MADAIASLVDILQSNWNKPPQPSIEDIADLDKGDAKRVRMLDKDVIRIFETAHNEAQPELLYDFVNQHVNLTIDIRSVKTRERLSELRDETRRILHAFRKGDGINFDRIIFKTRTDLSDRSKKLFRYTLQCEVVTFTLDATGDGGAVVNPATGAVTVGQAQAFDTDLSALAALTHSDGAFIVSDGSTWVAESGATVRTSLGLGSLATESSIDTTNIADSAIITSSESFADSDTAIMTAAAIEDKILSYGYTTETGDITGVAAGTGLSGGGTSGDVTLNVDTNTIATKSYVDTSVSNLVDGAPGVLDTLNELAAAIGDDASFTTTITTSIGTKLAKASNLSDLTNAATARTNLGLGALATQSLANGADNRVITSTSSSTLNAEATLTYDGAKLEINNGAGEVIGIGGGGTGYQSIEIGGDTGAFIDLKSPASDDYDLRIISTGSGGTIQTSSPLTLSTGSGNSDITMSPHGTGNVQVNADIVITGDVSVSGGYGLAASDIPNLATSKITSGTFADARIAASNVTQHQAALSITESQISDLQSYLTAPRTVTAGGNTLANGETLAFTAGASISISESGGAVTIASTLTLLDEDNMSSNSATAAASQQSIKAYVDAEVASLIDSAPSALNTLNELAAALGDDASFSTTTATSLGNRLRVDVNNQGLNSTQQGNALTNLGITASLAEINILDDGLAASDIPSLATSKITSGTFANARISEGSVTQHQAALSITESQISDLQSYLTAPRTVTAGGNTLANGETLAFTAGSGVTITESGGAVTIATTPVTLDTSSHDYLSISGQAITLGQIDISDDTNLSAGTGLSLSGDTMSVNLSASDIPNLAASKITSGTFADGRIAQSNVTQHLAVASQGGIGLSGKTFSLDIDGMADIGAGLVDSDLLIVDDGADGTNRKAEMSRLRAYMQSNLTFTTDTNTQNVFASSFVDSSDDIILRLTKSGASSGTQDVKITAGSNITLTHVDAENITIAAVDTNTQLQLLDEDNFASNSNTAAASQQSIKAYVDGEVASLVDSAPGALNTLNELAAAINDDASFSSTVTTSLGNRLRIDVSNQSLTSTQKTNALTNLGITATPAEINILDDGLSASDIPNLATSKIDSGTFDDARIAQSNVTQHLAVASGGGIGLSGKTFSLDLDGMTDIGAALVDADLFAVDDGANGTNKKATMGRLKTYMQNNLTFAASDTNTQNVFTSSFVDSTDDIILRLTKSGASSGTQDITMVAGSGITLTHDSSSQMTIASTTTANDATITLTAGTGLSGGGNLTTNQSGNETITFNVSGLTVSEFGAAAIQLSTESFSDSDAVLMTAAAVNDRIESFGYTTNTGDITSVTAGTGLTGGDTSGDVTITLDLKDEDNMASNSASHAASQQSIKAYVDNEIANLIDSAPGALDTLNELAAAINDDASFHTTITNSIGTKLAKASNLSDLASASTARSNLGLGAAAVKAVATDGESGVADGEAGLVTGNAVFDYIANNVSAGAVSAVANGADNRVATFSSGTALNGEANLTFDGSTLSVNDAGIDIREQYGRLNFKKDASTGFVNNYAIFFYNNTDSIRGAINFNNSGERMGFRTGSAYQIYLQDGVFYPVTDNDVDLGKSTNKFKDSFFGLVDAENFKINGSQGSDGQVLTSTGSGVAWESVSAGGGGDITGVDISVSTGISISQSNTSSGDYTATLGLDLDGMTDIGEALVDADLMIVDNGAGGTNRKATMGRLKTYMQNNLTFTTNTNQLTTFTLTGDSGSNQTIAHGNTLDIAGGDGIATVVGATDTVTVGLDIDGMTDIGAALADADLMIVDDGAGGTNRKATMSRLKTYMQNNLTFTTNTDTQLSTEQVQDIAGPLVATGGTKTRITIDYDDTNNNMDFVVDDMNFSVSDITGATALTSGLASTDEFVISDAGTLKRMDTSVLQTYMQNNLTFTTNTDTQLTTEQVQDIVGAMFTSNTETRITAEYQDGDGTIDLIVDDMTADTNTFRTVTAGGNTLGGSETLAFTAGSNVTITESGGAVTIASTDTNTQLTLLDEDDMSSNSATAAASQQSIKAYVDSEVSGLVDSAPSALNTLNELAAALGDDASFSTTTATSLGNRLRVDVSNQGLTSTQQANALTNLGITASLAEINILDDGLAASDITSGTFADARIAESNVTQHLAAGTGLDLSGKTFSVDVSDFMTNGSNNRILTATGTDAMNAEANLTFDGSTLALTGDLNVGSGDLFVDDSAGRVGIGTTNPQGNLHVVGETGDAGRIYLSDADNGTGSGDALLITKSGTNAFIYNRDSSDLRLGSNDNSNYVAIKSDGDVGIGTTSPEARLEVVAALNPSSATQFSYAEALKLDVENSGTATGPAIRFRTGATSDHNAADYMFQVNGDGGGSSAHEYSHNYSFRKWHHTAGADGFKPVMRFKGAGDSSASGTQYGEIILTSTATAWDVYDGTHTGLEPSTYDTKVKLSGGEVSYINNGQNFGIGLTNPSTALEVASSGTIKVGNAQLSANNFTINNTGGYGAIELTGSSGGYLDLKTPSSDDFDLRLISSGTGGTIQTSSNADLTINVGTGDVNVTASDFVVSGALAATTKSFDIEHPTKEGMRLHHGSLEGPEHGVYIRGRLEGNEIDLPDYWLGLVDEDTITVQLTPNKGFQQIYVRDISENKVHVASHDDKPIDCFYFIQGERKDIEKFEVEY